MKISTKGRYGLRSMLDLAVHSTGDQVALNAIAERQSISPNYLEQVFSLLRKAGLVKSVKGAQGGYVLADHPSKISVGSILRALEGELTITADSSEELDHSSSIEYCLRTRVWDEINTAINSVVDGITLEDLVQEYKKLQGNLSLMFYI